MATSNKEIVDSSLGMPGLRADMILVVDIAVLKETRDRLITKLASGNTA
jgi:hypothetical protein